MATVHIDLPYPKVKPSGHYVYVHNRLTRGDPFYVGKGSWDRAWEKAWSNRSEWWMRVALKYGVGLEICQYDMSEGDANTLERWLIAKLRHEGHELVNLTDGGEGKSGIPMPESTRSALIASKEKIVWCSNGMCFTSYKSAAEWLKSQGVAAAKGSNIGLCVRGETGSAYGYFWSSVPCENAEFETRAQKTSRRNSKRVERSDGVVYDSVMLALNGLESIGVFSNNFSIICACARGERNEAHGFSWRYV